VADQSPYDPQQSPDPNLPPPDPGIVSQIQSALGDPRSQAALLTFGLNLMQPPSFGDNATSQIGRAIGSAGESGRSLDTQEQKQLESESKADLRSTQSDLAAAKAATAGVQSSAAADRLQYLRDKMSQDAAAKELQQRVVASGQYQAYLTALNNQNLKAQNEHAKRKFLEPDLPDFTPQQPIDFQTYVATHGLTGGSLLGGNTAAPAVKPVTPPPNLPPPADRPDGLAAPNNQPFHWSKSANGWVHN
jgi:hypothetical protein